nr:hypothetical protein CFP56_54432 [Quercus suber]
MKFYHLGLAAAIATAVAGAGLHSTSTCLTITKTHTATKTVKTIKANTVAGRTSTETLTITSTKYPTSAASTQTTSAMVTSTVFNPSTYTPTSTSYFLTSTITVAPTTTTATAPPGFTPIKATIPASYDPRKRNLAGGARAGLERNNLIERVPAPVADNKKGSSISPRSRCSTTKYIPKTITITKTAKHNVTRTAFSSIATVKTTSTKITTASYATAATTVTKTITSQPQAAPVTTTELTNTIYETAAVATFFQACDTSNQLQSLVNGQVTPDDDALRTVMTTFNAAGSAYDCCVAAIRGGYAGSLFGGGGILQGCNLVNNHVDVCAYNGTQTKFQMLLFGSSRLTLSNAYCGALIYNGIGGGAPTDFLPPAPQQT